MKDKYDQAVVHLPINKHIQYISNQIEEIWMEDEAMRQDEQFLGI